MSPENRKLYAADQSQEIPLLVETETAEVKVTHVIAPLTDKLLIEFDETRQVAVVGDNRQTGTETHTAAAAVKLWDKACLSVRGVAKATDPPSILTLSSTASRLMQDSSEDAATVSSTC